MFKFHSPRLAPPPFIEIGKTRKFFVYGKGFKNITGVYLSGSPYPEATTQILFSGSPTLSGNFPPFTGVQVLTSSYVTDNDTYISFVAPSATYTGYVDVIVANIAGYGAITTYAVTDTYNPYLTSTPEFSAFEPFTPGWANGIVAVDRV